MDIRQVIYDLDGVLVDSFSLGLSEIGMVIGSFGQAMPPRSEIIAAWGGTFKMFLERLFSGISVEAYLERRDALGLERVLPPLIPGAAETVLRLGREYAQAIVSNRERTTLNEIIDGSVLPREAFRLIQSCTDVEYYKPDPRVFDRLFLGQNGGTIPPGASLYVGDLVGDFEAASGAGLQFVGVLSGIITTREEFLAAGVPATNILDSVNDLAAFLHSR